MEETESKTIQNKQKKFYGHIFIILLCDMSFHPLHIFSETVSLIDFFLFCFAGKYFQLFYNIYAFSMDTKMRLLLLFFFQ